MASWIARSKMSARRWSVSVRRTHVGGESAISYAGVAASFCCGASQLRGRSSCSRDFGQVGSFSKMSFRQCQASCPLSLASSIKLIRLVSRSPAVLLPTNNQFFLPCAIGTLVDEEVGAVLCCTAAKVLHGTGKQAVDAASHVDALSAQPDVSVTEQVMRLPNCHEPRLAVSHSLQNKLLHLQYKFLHFNF